MASGRAIKYTDEMLDWVKDNQADITRAELTELFNSRFDMDLGRGTLAALCNRKGWKNSHSGRIEKGAVPWNKDKKGYMGATARTLIVEKLKYPENLIEMQLGHNVRDMHGRAYNRTVFLDERRDMMQHWADYLDTLKTDTD